MDTAEDRPRGLGHPQAIAISGRMLALDGIRAFAILLVLVAHTAKSPLGDALGSLGVNLFFVLSGFLITSLLAREFAKTGTIDLRAFYMRRIRRIFPAYYVYLAIIVITTLLGFTAVDSRALVFDALFLKNYAFAVPIDWWTGHTWTLCIEQQFYLIWPIVLVIGGWKIGWRFAAACIVLEPAIRIVAYILLPAYRSFIDIMLPTRIDMLMFGCILAIACAQRPSLVTRFSERSTGWALGCAAVCTAFGLVLTVRYHGAYAFPVGYTVTGLAGAIAILYVVRYPESMLARWLSLAPIMWLGRISYSLYLWQQPFLTPNLNHTFAGKFPVNLLAALVMATASYYIVESRFFTPKPVLQPRLGESPA